MSATQHAETTLPIDAIHVPEGHNPRRAFRKEPLDRLIASIRDAGLLQAVLVRPDPDVDGQYLLIAGERRLRACRALDFASVPARIRECDEAEARKLALLENIDRADLSASEEAIAARDILDMCHGDIRAAAAQLGWTESKMKSRMLLLASAPEVLQAVADGRLLVGHAELLSGLPHGVQTRVLPRVLERDMTVDALREEIKGVVIPLSSAIFSLNECQGCIHNTQTQGALFDNAVKGSNCQKKSCFEQKTRTELDARRTSLQEDAGTVSFVSEKDPTTYTSLIVEGPGGVGKVQFSQCKSCTHFGALIHDRLDAKAGSIEKPICFELPCHRSRVAEYAEACAPKPVPDEEAVSAFGTKPRAATKKAAPPKTAPTKGKPVSVKAKAVAPAAVSAAARAAMRPAYGIAATQLVATNTNASLALAVFGLHRLLMDGVGKSPLDAVTSAARRDKPELVVAELFSLPEAQLVAHFKACTTALVDGSTAMPSFIRNDAVPAVLAAKLVQQAGLSLTDHFCVTDAFLTAHTRDGIESLLEESGYKAWLLAKEDGAVQWKALSAMKKGGLVTHIMASGFDFAGFVPASVVTVSPRAFVGV
ncbi:MAG: PRTRC system ParB family protein [Rhodanobacter sp.]